MKPYRTLRHAPEVTKFDAVCRDAYVCAVEEIENNPHVGEPVRSANKSERFLIRSVSWHVWLVVGYLAAPNPEFREIYFIFAQMLDDRKLPNETDIPEYVRSRMNNVSLSVAARLLAE